MRIRFWGTRGSMAKPGPRTVRYGGNTSCVELRAADGTLIVLDCGTGAHELGQSLMASRTPVRAHLLFTHTHWDHIQGFPFFGPLFVPGNEWDLYAPHGRGQRLEVTLAGQMEYPYFPVTLDQLGATIRYHDLAEGALDLGSVHVTTCFLNHPGLALGYRLEADGATVVYATDHEPHSPHPDDGAEGPVHLEDRRHVQFLSGADLLIHDSQYTLEEYPKKRGWGHSPAERVVDFALAAGVACLALYHHDPMRSDDALDRLVDVCRQRAAGHPLEIFAAAEGQVVEVAPRQAGRAPARPASTAVVGAGGPAPDQTTVLLVDDDPDVLELLAMTLEEEGFRLLSASDGETALAIARTHHPDLMLLDWSMPGLSGLEVCRAVRASADPWLRQMPVVMLTAQAEADHTAAGFAAGVTDYVIKPFKPTHVRTRVRTWLLRGRAGSTRPDAAHEG